MWMKRAAIAAATGLAIATSPASAGVFADDLAKCVVNAASAPDRTMVMKWLFAAMAANPELKPMATITQTQREALNRDFAGMSERLLLNDCRKETVTAFRNEGPSVAESAFRSLGESAMVGLLSDPDANKAMEGVKKYVDPAKWAALALEAAMTPGKAPPPAGQKAIPGK